MLTCEDCGALVEPSMADRHQEWHKDLVTVSGLKREVANPNRVKVDKHGFSYMECTNVTGLEE